LVAETSKKEGNILKRGRKEVFIFSKKEGRPKKCSNLSLREGEKKAASLTGISSRGADSKRGEGEEVLEVQKRNSEWKEGNQKEETEPGDY